MEQIKTGIEGLDALLYGGIPQGRTCLISGEPGTGKTIFSLQFLLEGLQHGEKALYITIDEKPEHVLLDAESLGWSLRPFLDNGSLKILDVTGYFSTSKIGDYDGIDINQIIDDIMALVQSHGTQRLAIDPIAPLVFSGHSPVQVVEYIRRLIFTLETVPSCTTLLTSYVPVGSTKMSHHGIEEFAASGIILLRLVHLNHNVVRSIRVRKMRGTRIDLTEYSFEILPHRGFVLRQPIS
jgi:circadian clock protein KaiC